jgi:hypothetical protein
MQLVCIVDGMPSFMAEDASTFRLAGAFDFEHLISLKPHETRVRQIEGYCESKHSIRIEEFLRQPRMRQGRDVARLKLSMKTLHPSLHQRAFQRDRQVAQASGQQCFIACVVEHKPYGPPASRRFVQSL